MKLIKTVKRIMALSTGAAMVGATVLSASAAADLANYPAPFVKDGKFNGVLVVGDSANSADVLGSVDIATSLQFAARVKKTVSTSGGARVSTSGELWRVGTSTKKLEMSESLSGTTNAASAKQETIRNITSFITDDELPVLLADRTFSNDNGDYDYRQYIYFDNVNQQTTTNPASLSVIYAEDPDTDVTADYFYAKNNDRVARYSLEFTSSAESDITNSDGSATVGGTYLWDFEGKDIEMLGKTFSIVKARTTADTAAGVELTLMGGAVRDALSEGETKTYTVNNKDYEVTLDFVGSTTAKFNVDGQLTDSMQEGGTYKLADGSQIGVKDILSQEFAGGVRRVEFYVGADKIFLKDTDKDSVGSGSAVLEVGSEKVDDSKVTITGSNTTTNFKIDTIQINISADDDLYVPSGGKLSDVMEEPEALINSWDLSYEGLEDVAVEPIKIKTSGSNQYELEFVDGSGNTVSMPLAYTSGGTNVSLGDNDNALVISENTTIARNDYFVVSDSSQSQGERRTYVVRYKGASPTSSTPVIKFNVLGESNDREETFGQGGDAITGAEAASLKLGGATYNVWNTSAGDDFNIVVDLDGDGLDDTVATNESSLADAGKLINVTTNSGAQILVSPYPVNGSHLKYSGSKPLAGVNISIQTPNGDDFDNLEPTPVDFDISATSGEVRLTENNVWHGDHNYKSPEGETNTNYAYTTMGGRVKFDNPTNDPGTLDYDYLTVQRLPLVYITGPGATINKGEASEAGDIVYYDYTPIAVGAAKLAGEVANLQAQNAIVIGGPCANAAAAELMGNPANCAEGFESGKAMVKLYEHSNGNVAMLVAGFSASDTRRAARVVANYEEWQDAGQLKGMEVEVSGTSFTDISVGEPTVPEPAAPAAGEGDGEGEAGNSTGEGDGTE